MDLDAARASCLVVEEALLSVAALHALAYCERLFYLEEVERIRVQDAAVFAGRRLHVEIAPEGEDGQWSKLSFESETLGIRGTVDVLKRRDGGVVPYEHKRGKSAGRVGARESWRSDRIQACAYGLLVEEALGTRVTEVCVRYHADNVLVTISLDEAARAEVTRAVSRARTLRTTVNRPPVTDNERLCVRCSLAPVCLPEEARLARDPKVLPLRLLPAHPEGQALHILESGSHVGRAGSQLEIRPREGDATRVPIGEVGSLVLHGFAQATTQALRLCSEHEIPVFWLTQSGGVVGSFAPAAASAQRHVRQFRALTQPEECVRLARLLVHAKAEGQLRFLLRATRSAERGAPMKRAIETIREALKRLQEATSLESMLGQEGAAAAAYFGAVPLLLSPDLDPRLRFEGRNRRPPRDRFNAALSFGYGLLYRDVLAAVLAVGLHPGLGFYHQPRTSAHTLVLDLMELFRVPLVDMPLIGAFNRKTFDADADFREFPGHVLMEDGGRRKLIEVIERRKADTWKHSVVGYSLSYARVMELEVRLLEKEWSGEAGLFAKFRLR